MRVFKAEMSVSRRWMRWSSWGNKSEIKGSGVFVLLSSLLPQAWAGIDRCHAPRYISGVMKTFADKLTKERYESDKSKRFPPGIWKRALRRVEYLGFATSVTDLKMSPSNRLHNWSEPGLTSIRFPSTTNGECAFDLMMAMRTMLR